MLKNIFSFVILLIGIKCLYSQTIEVNGTLKDKNAKTVIEFATIVVYDINDSIQLSLISNTSGEFSFEIEKGEYRLDINCMGYKSISKKLVLNESVFLGNIFMDVDSKMIDGINVTSSSQIRKYDKDILPISNDLCKGATRVNDLLHNIRGVDVDPIDNSIYVNNSKNTLLLVDGLKKDSEYIKNIPPEKVSRIEILRNPSGRYLTEGYDAVINFVMKKNYTGHDLLLNQKGIYSFNKGNGDDIIFSNNVSCDYTFTYKKVNIYCTLASNSTNKNLPFYEEKYFNGDYFNKTPTNDYPNVLKSTYNNKFVLGMDLFLNPKHSWSLELDYLQSPHYHNSEQYNYLNELTSANESDYFSSERLVNNNRNDLYAISTYRFNISESKKIQVDYCYRNDNQSTGNKYYEDEQVLYNQKVNQQNHNSKIEISYNHSFHKNFDLDIGYRNFYRTTEINNLENEVNNDNVKNNRNSVFAFLSYTPSGKVKAKSGFSIESNAINFNDANYRYISLQPYLHLNYQYSKKTDFTIKINSQANYPSEDQIDPFELVIDRFTSQKGNPSLNFATNYYTSVEGCFFENSFCLEPFYQYSNNFISKTGSIVNNQYYQYTFSNIDRYESLGINSSIRYVIFPRTLIFKINGNLFYDKTTFNDYSNKILDYTLRSSLIFIEKKYKGVCVLTFKRMNAKKISAYGYYNNDNDYLSLLLSQPFFQKKLSITMFYVFPINAAFNYELSNEYIDSQFNQTSTVDISILKNFFMLNLTYSINRGREIKTLEKKDYIEKQKGGFF